MITYLNTAPQDKGTGTYNQVLLPTHLISVPDCWKQTVLPLCPVGCPIPSQPAQYQLRQSGLRRLTLAEVSQANRHEMTRHGLCKSNSCLQNGTSMSSHDGDTKHSSNNSTSEYMPEAVQKIF